MIQKNKLQNFPTYKYQTSNFKTRFQRSVIFSRAYRGALSKTLQGWDSGFTFCPAEVHKPQLQRTPAAFAGHESITELAEELLGPLYNFTTIKNKQASARMWRWKKVQVYDVARLGIYHNHFCFFKRQLNPGHRLSAMLLRESDLAQNELVSRRSFL